MLNLPTEFLALATVLLSSRIHIWLFKLLFILYILILK